MEKGESQYNPNRL